MRDLVRSKTVTQRIGEHENHKGHKGHKEKSWIGGTGFRLFHLERIAFDDAENER